MTLSMTKQSSGWWRGAVALLASLCLHCDGLWVTICTEGVDCEDSASTDGGGKIDQTQNTTSPIGPTRKFEWRAKVQVDAAKLKYVGMKGTTPVFLRNEGASRSSWVAFQLDLLNADQAQRVKSNTNWAGFPAAPDHDFLNTPILVSGGPFYKLSNDSKMIKDLATDQEIYKVTPQNPVPVRLPDSPPFVYFRHPEQSALAVTTKPGAGFQGATLMLWPSGGMIQVQSSTNAPATALVLGDLDATDPASNGTEVIWFVGNEIKEVRHQGGVAGDPSYPDSLLKIGLQEAIDRNEKDGPIQGGFVAKLNDDRFMDFVYTRGSKLFVTSYIGRSESGIGLFADWPKEGLPSLPLERVKSIQAIDLTKEGYPELVVETDQAVHFYLSVP